MVEVTDLTEAVEAAARARYEAERDRKDPDLRDTAYPPWEDLAPIARHLNLARALEYITGAAPVIERQVREQVARDIEAEMPPMTTRQSGKTARLILREAARIARGGAS